ncbi:Uncharacterised protein [Mycobacterium tuberculosis]|uniref:Uncharacterized protein n=1 Tax=Mycobacterium tuberculosis TaxID=1773 RepID=A0A916LG70_MYCTX|nr:Uncharacterised protein [Mycobacterium tuberculosis]CPA53305.1 Uncharacterised protein [Mycobacterium tuberculosis]CPA89561.1 Uncharacterised protein [Mycobacterium tuberculosis]
MRPQLLHHLPVGLHDSVEVGVELTDRSVVQSLQAGIDVVGVHVDQHGRPFSGGQHDPGQVGTLAGVIAVCGPDHRTQHDRGDR